MTESPPHYPLEEAKLATGHLAGYRQRAEKYERETYFPKAAYSDEHTRFYGKEDDHRLPYKRDVDRIIHSKAYARYIDKTQVVYLVENDHITHRGLHVQLVSSFARGIAEILRLNLDLVEAVSLGHDVGHPPFGHEGEGYLSDLSIEYDNGPFVHPHQSCRVYTQIEPLNLGLAVYDGILCHDGGMQSCRLEPRFGKSWQDHFADRELKLTDLSANIIPGTLEGCLVKMCDTMSYLSRDLEDAISLGIITRDQVPDTMLGRSNREILQTLSMDIIRHSFEKEYIAMSEEAFQALRILRKFNFENIYTHPKLKVESKKIEKSYRVLFQLLLDDLEKAGAGSYLETQFVANKSEMYRETTGSVQKVVDYISGMTDNFFVRTLEKLLVPGRIEL